jgi:hypothetical protein
MITIEQAIHSLIPNAEWHLKNDELTVFTPDIIAPTMKEILAEKKKLEQIELENETKKTETRLAALSKLQILGLSEDDLKALGF